MLSSIKKDKKYRACVKKFEIKKLQRKTFLQDFRLQNCITVFAQNGASASLIQEPGKKANFLKRTAFYFSLQSQNSLYLIPRNSSKTRIQNRCIETGRARSVLKFCKLSRIVLRKKASKGVIPGISKASW